MQHIARLLEIPGQSGPPSPAFAGQGSYNRPLMRCCRERYLFNLSRGPGIAAPRKESPQGVLHKADESLRHRDSSSPNRLSNLRKEEGKREMKSRESSANRGRSREGSPRMPRPRSEEIPLELIKKAPTSVIDMAPKITIMPRYVDTVLVNLCFFVKYFKKGLSGSVKYIIKNQITWIYA